MARTMSDEQEREDRAALDRAIDERLCDAIREPFCRITAELDAERDAHEETKADAEGWRNGQAQVQRDFDLLYADTQALKARLALAEKWAAFGSDCFDAFWGDGEPCDLEAGDLQERAVTHGLLRPMTEADGAEHAEGCDMLEGTHERECSCLLPALAAWRAAK